jgi:hypothetical protein
MGVRRSDWCRYLAILRVSNRLEYYQQLVSVIRDVEISDLSPSCRSVKTEAP